MAQRVSSRSRLRRERFIQEFDGAGLLTLRARRSEFESLGPLPARCCFSNSIPQASSARRRANFNTLGHEHTASNVRNGRICFRYRDMSIQNSLHKVTEVGL